MGSDDVLAMIFQTFFNSDLPILFPDITYAFYPVWCDLFRIPYEVQPLNEKLEIVPEDYYKPNGGIVFPNPNAPTGIAHGNSVKRNLKFWTVHKCFLPPCLNLLSEKIVAVLEKKVNICGVCFTYVLREQMCRIRYLYFQICEI